MDGYTTETAIRVKEADLVRMEYEWSTNGVRMERKFKKDYKLAKLGEKHILKTLESTG
jgi:hypothetical protein